MSPFSRHTRVWPTAASLAALASVVRDVTSCAALELWSTRGWPLVVRRAEDEEAASDDPIAVGLPLPPSLGKGRLKFRLPRDGVAAHAPSLTLDEVVTQLRPTFSSALTPLARAAARERIVLRVFGSAAWEVQTGLGYLRADSDLDLLAEPATRAELSSVLALLDRVQERLAMRLDGEIVFPGGDAVAWREWAFGNRESRVLVKNMSRVALVARSDLESKLDRHKRLAA
jgi:phosphoribosyl-dephospho-CoA transferase